MARARGSRRINTDEGRVFSLFSEDVPRCSSPAAMTRTLVTRFLSLSLSVSVCIFNFVSSAHIVATRVNCIDDESFYRKMLSYAILLFFFSIVARALERN